MRWHRRQKQAAPHPAWSTKCQSLVLQKQRWLQAPHNIEATYQDHYSVWDTLRKRSAGSTGQPTHQKETPEHFEAQHVSGAISQAAAEKVSAKSDSHQQMVSLSLESTAHQSISHQATLTTKQATAICKWKHLSTSKMDFARKHFTSWQLLLLFMPLITLTALCRTGCNWKLHDCT